MKLYDLKKMNIDVMIAVCHIIDNYDEFNNNLVEYISSECNRDDIWNLHRVCVKSPSNSSIKAKTFYKKNKKVINTIMHRCNIIDFICSNYNINGKLYNNSCLDTFSRYLKQHLDKIDIIIANLQKIKSLGFKEIFFDENLDFNNESYKVSKNFNNNFEFIYLDNIEVLQNYDENVIEYKTTNSDYKAILFRDYKKEKVSNCFNKIILNNLTFDLDRLPNEMSKESTFDYLVSLNEKQKGKNFLLNDSKALNKYINELYSSLILTSYENNNKDEIVQKRKSIKHIRH